MCTYHMMLLRREVSPQVHGTVRREQPTKHYVNQAGLCVWDGLYSHVILTVEVRSVYLYDYEFFLSSVMTIYLDSDPGHDMKCFPGLRSRIRYTFLVRYTGPLGAFLSWSGWAPLSKLTYAAYLIHPFVLDLNWKNRFNLLYFEHFTLVSKKSIFPPAN